MKYLSLFSGIGSPEQALKNIGIEFELLGFSEIDKYAIKSYCDIHNVNESLNLGDITKINIESLPTGIDLVTHGSPCQDFSVAGKGKGADQGAGTRSSLVWNTVAICEHCKPKYVVWENVKNVLSKKHRHNFDKYLKEMDRIGYQNFYQVLNAKDYGIPQNRQRVFVISIKKELDKQFEFPKGEELKIRLKDILEDEVDKKYYINKPFKLVNKGEQVAELDCKDMERQKRVYGIGSVCPTILARPDSPRVLGYFPFPNSDKKHQSNIFIDMNCICNTIDTMQGGSRQPKILTRDTRVRKLTPKECWRLMGFKDEQFHKAEKVCSNSQLYKQAGNSIVVNVMEEIFKSLI